MEVPVNDFEKDILEYDASPNKETLDDVIEQLSDEEITALSLSFSHSEEAEVDIDLDAYADPPLPTNVNSENLRTGKENSDVECDLQDFENCSNIYKAMMPNIVYNEYGQVSAFEMVSNDKKLKVVDSNECLAKLENAELVQVEFNPHYYLAPEKSKRAELEDFVEIPKPNSDASTYSSMEPSDDCVTGALGPTFTEFNESSYSEVEH